jgi:two-component system nitrate/nitrite response regulator NarL
MPKPSTGRILTKRQEEIVALVAEGFSNKGIAEKLNIGAGTVKVHLHNIFEALGVRSRRRLFTFSRGTTKEARV